MATAAAKTSRPEPSADSYIGSLISLTSKSDIRYEGVLLNINTEESSISLKNVRSFGTEGRKEGHHVPPSDKVYEYILFRGSDIKDLQVKSSPPAQTAAAIHNDPAIIQSHYSRPAAPLTSLPMSDLASHSSQILAPRAPYQSSLPLYQPGGTLPPWVSSAPTALNPQGLAMPMYWPGFYAPANGMPPPGGSASHPSLLRPPGLTVPHPPLQYPGINPSLPPSSQGPPGLPNLPSQNAPSLSGIPSLPGSNLSLAPLSLPGSVSLPEIPPLLASAALPGSTLNLNNPPDAAKLPVSSLPVSTVNVDLTIDSAADKKSKGTAITTTTTSTSITTPKTNINTLGNEAVPSVSEPLSFRSIPDTLKPSLVTPGQLGQTGSLSIGPLTIGANTSKDESELLQSTPAVVREPILPLPRPSVQKITRFNPQKNGTGPLHSTHQVHRGRGRGRGQSFSRTAMRFTEDFDFTAMNEKFNKDEVWGNLGKGRDKEGNEVEDDADEIDYERVLEDHSKPEVKPVYVKDDFFDSLSNSNGGGSRNGRVRFSEQMKIDTETFGDFPRHRGGRGGGRGFRGGGSGGQSRGSFYGRSYGHSGRGQSR